MASSEQARLIEQLRDVPQRTAQRAADVGQCPIVKVAQCEIVAARRQTGNRAEHGAAAERN